MSRNPRAEFFDGPGGMCLSIVFYGWTASSSGTAPWLRVVGGLLLVAWVLSYDQQ